MEHGMGILLIYLGGVFLVGLWSMKYGRRTEGFYVADRKLPWSVVAMTISATVIGGSATIATAALAYTSGVGAITMDLAGGLGLIFLGIFLARKVRSSGALTMAEMAGQFYSSTVRRAMGIFIYISEIAWVGLLIGATGYVLSTGFGIPQQYVLLLAAGIFIFYTAIGGQYSVAYTDVIQFVVMFIGLVLIALPLAVIKLPPPSPHGWGISLGPLDIAGLFVMMFLPHAFGPDIYSKVLSARSGRDGRIGAVVSGMLKIVIGIAVVYIGLAAKGMVSGGEDILIATVKYISSPIIAAVIFTALVATMMSSADSCLLTASTTFVNDILLYDGRRKLFLTRIMAITTGIISLCLALLVPSILRMLTIAYTIYVSGALVPFVLGMWRNTTRVDSRGAMASIILGGGSSIVFLYLMPGYNAVLPAIVVGLIGAYIFSFASSFRR